MPRPTAGRSWTPLEAHAIHRVAASPALAAVVEALVDRGCLDEAAQELAAAGIGEDLPAGAPLNRLRYAAAAAPRQGQLEPALAGARTAGRATSSALR